MDKKIGFIGAGNMGQAIIGGIASSHIVPSENIGVYDVHPEKLADLTNRYAISAKSCVQEVVESADILFLAIKPNVVSSVLIQAAPYLTHDKIIVSIAAGVSLEQIETVIGKNRKIIRLMPNTPALVNEGMSSVTPNDNIEDEELDFALTLFNCFGKSAVVPESLIHSVVAVSGSAPAYVFLFIEAMADAAVLEGMPRKQAYQFAAQTVLGAAKMVIETGQHPGEIKDMVCSPEGTTIEAVRTLEAKGLRSAVIEAMHDCAEKSRVMTESKR